MNEVALRTTQSCPFVHGVVILKIWNSTRSNPVRPRNRKLLIQQIDFSLKMHIIKFLRTMV